MSNCAAIAFSNGLGNFLLMTSALKILRTKKYDEIDLLTGKDCLKNNPAVSFLAERFFDNVVTEFPLNKDYDDIFQPRWSFYDYTKTIKSNPKATWWTDGTHEISVYLEAIGAVSDDFCGFLMDVDKDIELDCEHPRIVFANASASTGSRRGSKVSWNGFPELSKILLDLGFNVILVGQGDELRDCVGINYIDKLNIAETAGVIQQCDLMICTDTGLMHVADAVGTPILLLAGPTPVSKSHPVSVEYQVVRRFISCAPCFQSALWNMCAEPQCMKLISVEDVLSKISKMVKYDYSKPDILQKVSSVPNTPPSNKKSVFEPSVFKLNQTIYDPSYDMIGDTLGAAFLLQWIKNKHPEIILQWYNAKTHHRMGDGWFDGFNVFDWVKTDIEVCNQLSKESKVITCRKDFYVWDDLQYLSQYFNYYPKMKRKRLTKKLSELLPKNYVVIHVLQSTQDGERSGKYVKRRALDFDKYSKLCYQLQDKGFNVVRVGAAYDAYDPIDGITDLSKSGLSLDESFRVIGSSNLLLCGDVGLKLAASAMDVPCIIEIDDYSKSIGGLGGCDPEIVQNLPLGIPLETLYSHALEILS